MEVRYSDTEILFIKPDDKNMLCASDCHCCIYNFLLVSLLFLCNFSCNSALWRNRGGLNKTKIWQNKHMAKCIALHFFLKGSRSMSRLTSRESFSNVPQNMLSYYCLVSEVMWGFLLVCVCVCSLRWWFFNPNRGISWTTLLFLSIDFARLLFGKFFLLHKTILHLIPVHELQASIWVSQ